VTISEFVVVVVCNSSKKVIRTNGEEYIRGNASTRLVRKGPIWYTHAQMQEMVNTRVQEEDARYDQLLQDIQRRHVIEMQQYKDLLEGAKVDHMTEMEQSNEIVYSYYRKERDMARTSEHMDFTPCLVPVLAFFVMGCVYVWLRP
jgi:hypothetical protein